MINLNIQPDVEKLLTSIQSTLYSTTSDQVKLAALAAITAVAERFGGPVSISGCTFTQGRE